MKRQITIYESAQNGKITVFNDVECNTVAELKSLLREKNINYNGMEFVEGVTNTKLLADDSRIPDNIPYKGKITNNVFINILKKESKISSGMSYKEMSRGDLLRAAKPYAAEIQAEFNANYTRVKSADIVSFLEGKESKPEKADKNAVKASVSPKSIEEKVEMLKDAVVMLANSLDPDYDGLSEDVNTIFAGWCGESKKKEEEPKSFFDGDMSSLIRK